MSEELEDNPDDHTPLDYTEIYTADARLRAMHPLERTPLRNVFPKLKRSPCCMCLVNQVDGDMDEEAKEQIRDEIKLRNEKVKDIIKAKNGKYNGTPFGHDARVHQGVAKSKNEEEEIQPAMKLSLGIRSYISLLW
jgi:hypothetical protein